MLSQYAPLSEYTAESGNNNKSQMGHHIGYGLHSEMTYHLITMFGLINNTENVSALQIQVPIQWKK